MSYLTSSGHAGDFLKAIDGVDVEQESIKSVREMLLGPPGSWVSLELIRYTAQPRRERKKQEIVVKDSVDTSRANAEERTIVTGLDGGDQPLVSTLRVGDVHEPEPEAEPVAEDAVEADGGIGKSLQREIFEVTLVRGVRMSKAEVFRSSYSSAVSTTWT